MAWPGVRADSLLEQRALERLLIAITYRVQGDRWDVLDVPAILDYLAAHEERFILGRFLAYSGGPGRGDPPGGGPGPDPVRHQQPVEGP